MRMTIALAATLALGACAPRQQLESGTDAGRIRSDRLVRYQCNNGVIINTFRRENGDIDVEWNGRRYALVKREATVENLWTDGEISFRERGQEAALESRGTPVASGCLLWR